MTRAASEVTSPSQVLPGELLMYVEGAKSAITDGKKPVFFAYELPAVPEYAPLLDADGNIQRRGPIIPSPNTWQWDKGPVCAYPCPHRLTLYFEDGSTAALSPAYANFEHQLAPHIQSLSHILDTPFRDLETHWVRDPRPGPIQLDTPFPGKTRVVKTRGNWLFGACGVAVFSAFDGFGLDEVALALTTSHWGWVLLIGLFIVLSRIPFTQFIVPGVISMKTPAANGAMESKKKRQAEHYFDLFFCLFVVWLLHENNVGNELVQRFLERGNKFQPGSTSLFLELCLVSGSLFLVQKVFRLIQSNSRQT